MIVRYRNVCVALVTFVLGLSGAILLGLGGAMECDFGVDVPETHSGTIVVRPVVGVEKIRPGGGFTLEPKTNTRK